MDLSRALAGAYASAAGAQGASVGWGDATGRSVPGTGPSSLPYSATDLVQAFSLPGLDSASQGLAGLLPPELFAAMVQAGYATLGYHHNNNNLSSASGANNTSGANNNARNGQAQAQQQQQQQSQQALDPASSLRAALAAGAASDRQQAQQRGSPPASTSDLADAYAFRNAAAAGAAAAAAAAANNPAAAFGAFAQGTNAGVNYSAAAAALGQYAGANAAAAQAAMGMRPPACPPQFGPQVGAPYMQQGFLPYAFGGRDAQSAAAYNMAQQLAAAAGAYGFGQGGYGGAMDPYAQMQAAAAAAAQYRAMPQTGVQAPPPSNQAKELTEEDYIDDGSTRAVKRLRLVWTDKLHTRFEEALAKLGPDAVPKSILQEMGVEGITRENVASHLQKYRLQKKKKEGSDGTTGRTSPTSSSPRPMSGGNSGQAPRLEQHPIWGGSTGQERGKGGVVRHHSGTVKTSENHGSGSNNGNRNGDAPRRSVAPSPNRDAHNGTSRPLRSPPAHTGAAPRGPLSNLPEASTPSGISKGCAAEASAEADGEQQAEHAAKRQCISA